MCRIAGLVARHQVGPEVQKMIDIMAHGGPDDEGQFNSKHISLGHRRLSIIDLSAAGHQPMVDEASGIVLSFNGEIYNYKELRQMLKAAGLPFTTETDTEVIIRAYQRWGTESFSKLRGMFAFALFDTRKESIILARDPGAIKPLYYSLDSERLVFASEVKAFKSYDPQWSEDNSWQKLFLTFGFLPHPFTSLQAVHSLTPGCYLQVDIQLFKGAEISFLSRGLIKSHQPGNAGALVRNAVEVAVRRHLISDAPLGVFLSGGIDSSLLTLLAGRELGTNLRTVSVNFHESSHDEGPFQRQVLQKLGPHNHQAFVVTEEMFWRNWDNLWGAMDQPTVDGVNTYFVSQAARESGLKAVLSGLGADELFGGYKSFFRVRWLRYIRSIPAKAALARVLGGRKDALRRFAFLNIPGPIGDYLFLRGIQTPEEVASVLQCTEKEIWDLLSSLSLAVPERLSDADYASFLETQLYMRGQLLKDTDFMSMHFGLEVRVPFLDEDLVHTVQSIGLKNQIDQSYPKKLLTRSFSDILPDAIVLRKKQGFVFPFQAWLSNGIRSGNLPMSGDFRQSNKPTTLVSRKVHWSKSWSHIVLENFNGGLR
jgi:asparagine synthase (glutamine-hydrolysing)